MKIESDSTKLTFLGTTSLKMLLHMIEVVLILENLPKFNALLVLALEFIHAFSLKIVRSFFNFHKELFFFTLIWSILSLDFPRLFYLHLLLF